ncbi:MAG: hypothetical protein JOZ98_12130 [Solirubrobacterales bacterium]|nr:hypothetical protein [Solirubrobacterales bacterium]MBV9797687.1 hypothetical protein [Solirubrobacterales bacterium]
MQRVQRTRGRRVSLAMLLAALAATILAACGSSSSPGASSLLQQTFSGTHRVDSGNLDLSLTIEPSGSGTASAPISLSFGGPFQSTGSGKLPRSDFSVTVSALGQSGSLGIVSTGTAGYVTLQGTSYRLPQATFQKLESSFAGITSSGSGAGSGTLAGLGIQPLHWLTNPTVVGTENMAGATTTHIHAGVNVSGFLNDLNTFLRKASTIGVSGANRLSGGLSPKARDRIAKEIQNPSFDVWTGNSDKIMRRMSISLLLSVTGQVSTLFGGMRSAAIALTVQYADLNQPQTITAPTTVRPFSEFTGKLRSLGQALTGALGATTSG